MRWLHWLSKRARAGAENRYEMLRRRRLFLEPLEIRVMRAGDTAEDPRQMLTVIDSTTVEQSNSSTTHQPVSYDGSSHQDMLLSDDLHAEGEGGDGDGDEDGDGDRDPGANTVNVIYGRIGNHYEYDPKC